MCIGVNHVIDSLKKKILISDHLILEKLDEEETFNMAHIVDLPSFNKKKIHSKAKLFMLLHRKGREVGAYL